MPLSLIFCSKKELEDAQKHYDIMPLELASLPHAYLRLVISTPPNHYGISAIEYAPTPEAFSPPKPDWLHDPQRLASMRQSILNYLQHGKARWDTPLLLPDSTFKRKAWEAMAAIPYGATISYSELAARAGNPKAIRAAASACATNPVPLILPCHRIIAKNGGLGGFAWGLDTKKRLLEHEQNRVSA